MTVMDVEPEISYDLDPLQVARCIIALDAERPEPDVTQLKLQKLMYLAQANHLAATGRRLFRADVEAFENGPVVYPVYREFASYSRSIIAPDCGSWDSRSLPEDARAFIARVWALYKDYTASALWRLTHDQAPWQEAYEEGAYRRKIPDSAMRDYFRQSVPSAKQVLHPDVAVVSSALLDDLDDNEDEIVAQALSALK